MQAQADHLDNQLTANNARSSSSAAQQPDPFAQFASASSASAAQTFIPSDPVRYPSEPPLPMAMSLVPTSVEEKFHKTISGSAPRDAIFFVSTQIFARFCSKIDFFVLGRRFSKRFRPTTCSSKIPPAHGQSLSWISDKPRSMASTAPRGATEKSAQRLYRSWAGSRWENRNDAAIFSSVSFYVRSSF